MLFVLRPLLDPMPCEQQHSLVRRLHAQPHRPHLLLLLLLLLALPLMLHVLLRLRLISILLLQLHLLLRAPISLSAAPLLLLLLLVRCCSPVGVLELLLWLLLRLLSHSLLAVWCSPSAGSLQ